jgi:hypothetical protein
MPFIPTQPNTNLPAPIVELLFKGQIILRPETDGAFCTVRLNRVADDHYLIIEVRAKRPRENRLVTRRAGLLANRLTIGIDPLPPPNERRVYAFQPKPFDRKSSGEVADLRWAIDLLHREEFHGPDSLVLHPADEPDIRIAAGIFFTADITDNREIGVRRTRGTDHKELERIATVIGVNLAPPAGSHVVLDWGAGDTLRLPRPEGSGANQDPAGTYYTVSVRNDPLAIDLEPTHDELELYYTDMVRKQGGGNVLNNERFQLEFSPRGVHSRSTDRIPCMPVLLGG